MHTTDITETTSRMDAQTDAWMKDMKTMPLALPAGCEWTHHYNIF